MAITQLYYFGTDLKQAGHYYWLIGQGFNSHYDLKDQITFDPEGLVYHMKNGDMNLITINDLNIIAICGSPTDTRPGSKSIFWHNKGVSFQTLKAGILTIPASKQIIDKMPFEVHWLI